MPGFVYPMEPRGDRMYALGFDGENAEGSLHVSLVDVADLANPILLSRVAFGSDRGSLAEGYDEATCEYDYGSGIQLEDCHFLVRCRSCDA